MISCVNLSKEFNVSRLKKLTAVQCVNLKIKEGAFLTVMGSSGSGKSSLLGLILGMIPPSKGEIIIKGRSITSMTEREQTTLRREFFGFVHQFPILHPSLSALENVILPLIVTRTYQKQADSTAERLLSQMGLADRIDHFPRQLSGGEAKRVAIARALIMDPPVIVTDEPTASLDQESGIQVLRLFKALHLAGKTVIMASHDRYAKKFSHEWIVMNRGKIVNHRMKGNEIGQNRIKDSRSV